MLVLRALLPPAIFWDRRARSCSRWETAQLICKYFDTQDCTRSPCRNILPTSISARFSINKL